MAEETAPDVVFVYYNGKQVRLERGIVDDNPESANQMKVRLATNTSHVFLLPILNKKGRPSGAQRRIEAMPDLDLPAIGNVTDLHLKKGKEIYFLRQIHPRKDLVDLAVSVAGYLASERKIVERKSPKQFRKDHCWPDEAS